jgi:2-polyprenyl-6-hydroxyphenyl methylase/3-demethylubiquinone-9 3-methyltransferase
MMKCLHEKPEETVENASGNVSDEEIEKFEKIAESWWNPNGPMRPLHKMHEVRIDWVLASLTAHFGLILDKKHPLEELRILDVGCGGGLMAEPMARLGADVTGIDVSETNIKVAKHHAEQMGLKIDYIHTSPEDARDSLGNFDVVLALEVIEHVIDPMKFVTACSDRLCSKGMFMCSTINRNMQSFVMAILGAEYILKWLPRGTHDWRNFIKVQELQDIFENSGLDVEDITGFVFHPLERRWAVSPVFLRDGKQTL